MQPSKNLKQMKNLSWAIYTIVAFFAVGEVTAQNLISNGGFEEFIECPVSLSSGNAIGVSGWQVPTSSGSPDYFNECGILPLVQVPQNLFGFQQAYEGSGYIGLYNYGNSGYREYIQIELDTPLEAGCKYYAQMFVSLADSLATCGTDQLGMFFSKAAPNNFEPFYAGILLNGDDTPFMPQVSNPTELLLSNYTSWEKISNTFIAEGGERYLTIGNFSPNEEVMVPNNCSAAWQTPVTTPDQPVSYYYIDDVSIAKVCLSISGIEMICPGDTITLSVANDPPKDYYWYDLSKPNESLSSEPIIEVSPLETTTYAVANEYDTSYFTVTVLSEAGIELGNDTTLCQGDLLELDASFPNASYLWDNGNTSAFRSINGEGMYSVTVAIGSCEIADTIRVEYSDVEPVAVALGEDLTLCLGETFELFPTYSGLGIFTWHDGNTKTSFHIDTAEEIWVVLENECFSDADTVNVSFQQCCDVFIPNAFSPNLDGINDLFFVYAGCKIEDFYISIFDKWGGQVYESHDILKGWDGQKMDKYLPSGSYVWFMEYVLPGEKRRQLLAGEVLLLK